MKCAVLILILSIVALGCESAVDPVIGDERPFTLWGVMNAGADTQLVRVFSIEGDPNIGRSANMDAYVTSTDLTTGEERIWIRREVSFENGSSGQVFWSPFRAEHGHSYRLDVARSDGAVSTATVALPAGVEVNVDTGTEMASIPIEIFGDVPNLIGAEMRYEATNVPPLRALPEGRLAHPPVFHPVHVSYEGKETPIEGGWQFVINMQSDVEKVRAEYEHNCLVTEDNPDIALRRVEFRFVAADEAWSPPGGTFDPEVLVEPGAFSNVENGYGFIGAGQVVRIRWIPVAPLREFLGFGYDRKEESADPPIPCVGENPLDIWNIFF